LLYGNESFQYDVYRLNKNSNTLRRERLYMCEMSSIFFHKEIWIKHRLRKMEEIGAFMLHNLLTNEWNAEP